MPKISVHVGATYLPPVTPPGTPEGIAPPPFVEEPVDAVVEPADPGPEVPAKAPRKSSR